MSTNRSSGSPPEGGRLPAAVFLAVTLGMCTLPFLLTLFGVGTGAGASKKEASAVLPTISDSDGVNEAYLSELGGYYAKSFAGRDAFLSLDSVLKGRLLMTSGVPGVVAGSDGWLFYRDTLADWQDSAPLSERQLFSIANNLAITQRYVSESDMDFAFMIAPNKNSLYGDNMPYYYPAGSTSANAERLAELLDELGVNTIDLFSLFRESDEILYLKNDSHWNNKGAAMVCNRYLESVGRGGELYDLDDYVMKELPAGDLYQMLCPAGKLTEPNQCYNNIDGYSFTGPFSDVEDAMLTTECPDGDGSLLMYRDSFGNSLLPFFAQRFGSAAFYRTIPYNMELHILQNSPGSVLIEKVERSLDELQLMPPVITAPLTDPIEYVPAEGAAEISVFEAEENMMFLKLSGTIGESLTDPHATVLLLLEYDGTEEWREAFTVTRDDGTPGFCAYIPQELLSGAQTHISAVLCSSDAALEIGSADMTFPADEFTEEEIDDEL